jgi:pteridine reductase
MPKKSTKGAALVTGAAKRIGKAIALHLAEQGYDIALHYLNSKKEAQQTQQEIQAKGVQCELFKCDLADEKETSQLIENIYRKFPQLTLLINNASIFEGTYTFKSRLEDFNLHYAIDLKAPYILTTDFANQCKKGHIINLLDTHTVKNKAAYVAYLLCKKSLTDITKMTAVEFAPDIRVNGIAPGIILPPEGKKEDHLNRLAKDIPLKKKGNPGYITHALQFLLENDFITGQIIFVDGGEHLL